MGDVIDVSWADVLRVDGVDVNGFGFIPKLVMIDHDISYKAKAIYAYLCSMAGNGVQTYPARSTILKDLSITKDAYYSHFKQLVDSGYVSVSKQPSLNGRFAKNVYTLVSNPKHLQDYIPAEGEGIGSRLRARGIKANGYGTIPRTVMTDKRIPIRAKALYAYLSSFAGAGDVAFPAQKNMLYHLDISVDTYRRALKELISCNYIEVEQHLKNGRFDRCYYDIVTNPDEVKGALEIKRRKELYGHPSSQDLVPGMQNQDTVELSGMEAVTPGMQKPDTVKPDMVKPDTEKSDTENQDITINSPSINSSSISSVSINQIISRWQPHWNDMHWGDIQLEIYDGLSDDAAKKEYIKSTLLEFPLNENPDQIHGEEGTPIYFNEPVILRLIDIVVKCSHKQALTINGQTISREIFMPRFLNLTAEDYQYVVESVSKYKGEIKNLTGYFITALFNAKEGDGLSPYGQFCGLV